MPGDLGRLEQAVMEILWSGGSHSVREIQHRLGGAARAYTTVMTTLDRLHA